MVLWFLLEAVVLLESVLTHSLWPISALSDSQQHKLVFSEVLIASQTFSVEF